MFLDGRLQLIDICAEGLPWEIELGDADGPHRSLETVFASLKRDLGLSTPSYAEADNTESKKFKTSEAPRDNIERVNKSTFLNEVDMQTVGDRHLITGSSYR